MGLDEKCPESARRKRAGDSWPILQETGVRLVVLLGPEKLGALLGQGNEQLRLVLFRRGRVLIAGAVLVSGAVNPRDIGWDHRSTLGHESFEFGACSVPWDPYKESFNVGARVPLLSRRVSGSRSVAPRCHPGRLGPRMGALFVTTVAILPRCYLKSWF